MTGIGNGASVAAVEVAVAWGVQTALAVLALGVLVRLKDGFGVSRETEAGAVIGASVPWAGSALAVARLVISTPASISACVIV